MNSVSPRLSCLSSASIVFLQLLSSPLLELGLGRWKPPGHRVGQLHRIGSDWIWTQFPPLIHRQPLLSSHYGGGGVGHAGACGCGDRRAPGAARAHAPPLRRPRAPHPPPRAPLPAPPRPGRRLASRRRAGGRPRPPPRSSGRQQDLPGALPCRLAGSFILPFFLLLLGGSSSILYIRIIIIRGF